MDINPAPDYLIPGFAIMYGVRMNVIEAHCGNYHHGDRLPRGCVKRMNRLRVGIARTMYSFCVRDQNYSRVIQMLDIKNL